MWRISTKRGVFIIFDVIRNKAIKNQPEEIVRQKLLHIMMKKLGYPKNYLCIEKELDQLPHLQEKKNLLPLRRADIICFGKNIHSKHSLYPLLMIECKAHKLTKKAIEQVVGYNYYVNAYFVAVANGREVKTLFYDHQKKKYVKLDFLPSYQQLIDAVKIC